MKRYFIIAMLALLSACAPAGKEVVYDYRPILHEASFSDLDGWEHDNLAEAYRMFAASCPWQTRRASPYSTRTGARVGDAASWKAVCSFTREFLNPTDTEARSFFEQYFTPYRVTTTYNELGRLTGYYEPLLLGSYTKTARFNVPVYGVPRNFYKPYYSRAQIVVGKINGKAPVLLYVDDALMLFFLHIQGSGKVALPDGSVVGLQFAAQNGHEYVPIGRVMKERGYLENVSLQTIRDWLIENPHRANEIMNTNPSYIFFTLAPGEAYAKGAMGISLTPERSVAVDDDQTPYALPIFVNTTTTRRDGSRAPFQKLMISQDTGGALLGAHRGDIFFGRGPEEEFKAGHQNEFGEVYWLLPNNQ